MFVLGKERVIAVCKAYKRLIPHMLAKSGMILLGEFAI
jgi:hypothetical protein